jgi:hypothetical protein
MFSFFTARGWNHSDWRVRESAALRLKDRDKLLQLALNDVATEVRVAAVKSLDDEPALLEVVRSGACEKSRLLALSRLEDPALRLQLARDKSVPVELRVHSLHGVAAGPDIEPLYDPREPAAFKVAVAERLVNQELLARIATTEADRELRLIAMRRLTNEVLCFSLLTKESDVGLRRVLSDRLTSPAMLREALADEDDAGNRTALVERIEDEALLAETARTDLEPTVRKAAIRRIRSAVTRVELACAGTSTDLALEALAGLADDRDRAAVATRAIDEKVRWEALRGISDAGAVRQVREQAQAPEIRWRAGRRLGELLTADFAQVSSVRILRQAIEEEQVPEVARWMIGHLHDRPALEVLTRSPNPHSAGPASQRLAETIGPYGIRFVPIPDRPYEMSAFVITLGQMRIVLGQAGAATERIDFPATGVPLELAQTFCARLTEAGGLVCRLPLFDEWLHACFTDDDTWFERRERTHEPNEQLLQAALVPINAEGPRSIQLAWPNPWGLLDMLGNVACWVDSTPRFLLRQPSLLSDPLAAGETFSAPEEFAAAAGVHWADQRVRRGRLERLVRRANLDGYARDKIGFRVIRENPACQHHALEFRLTLLAETAPGTTPVEVCEELQGKILGGRNQARSWYQVAPVIAFRSSKYEDVCRLKAVIDACGGRTRITTQPASLR